MIGTFQYGEFTYVVDEDEEGNYIGKCRQFPSLSHISTLRWEALEGIQSLVASVVKEMEEEAAPKQLFLYLLTQDENRGYNTYDSVVVCAHDEEEARNIRPHGKWRSGMFQDGSWATKPSNVKVRLIGEAKGQVVGIILSSFNAG